MTTIVYHHEARQIAVDGRVSSGSSIKSENATKWIKEGNDYWFLSGSVPDENRFIAHINADSPDKPKWAIDCSAILVRDGDVYICGVQDSGEPWKAKLDYNDSIGSGGVWALAALDFGKEAFDAVEYAITKDSGSGGKISLFDVDKMEFIE